MAEPKNHISLGAAALIAGLAILIMVMAAPFAEVFAYPRLVVAGNAEATFYNLTTHQTLFAGVIFAYAITFMCDTVAAWALYILMKPVNSQLALLTAWFRLVFAVTSIASLLNLVTVFKLLDTSLKVFGPVESRTQVMFLLGSFRSGFHFAILFFSIHLLLSGFLVFKSTYIPWIFGLLLVISGLGYLLTTVQPMLFPAINISFAVYTYYGELVFMLWLLIAGTRIKELN